MLRIEAIGNIGKDAAVNAVNAKNVINFSVAVTEKFKDGQGNQQEKTTWLDCALWRDSTAIAQYLTKGTKVFIDGTPEVRTYDKADGSKGFSLTVRVNKVELLGGRSQETQPASASAHDDNDLPF